MINETMNEHQMIVLFLQRAYLDELTRIRENLYGNKNPRPIVRYPQVWENQAATKQQLIESASAQLDPSTLHKDRNIWMWSDQHFFHKNIIRHANRPYSNVEEMNDQLISNYNKCVEDDDVCFWGGDVGFANDQRVNELLKQCKGYKILIIGNHDFNKKKLKKLNFDEIHLTYYLPVPEHNFFLTHYPMYEIEEPWFNLHGHVHATPTHDSGHPLHFNINCEAHEYAPISLGDIIQKVNTRKISKEL